MNEYYVMSYRNTGSWNIVYRDELPLAVMSGGFPIRCYKTATEREAFLLEMKFRREQYFKDKL